MDSIPKHGNEAGSQPAFLWETYDSYLSFSWLAL